MIRSGFYAFILLFGFFSSLWPQLGEDVPLISSPVEGQALQGAVMVAGSTETKGFQSAEVTYSYLNGNGSWFLINQMRDPVKEGQLAVWDTSTITDGDYALRVQIYLTDGRILEKAIQVRVRNYSPIETATIEPTQAFIEARATPTSAPTLYRKPTPTNLPANPVRVTSDDLVNSIRCGALFAMGLLTGLGIYWFYQQKRRIR